MSSKERRLEHARKVKVGVAAELKKLKAGDIRLQDVLRDPDDFMLSHCAVYDVLRWTPHMGRKGARRVCINSDVFPMDRICDLTKRERNEVLHQLPPRVKFPKEGR